jgi:effector-binding domain-containing protein
VPHGQFAKVVPEACGIVCKALNAAGVQGAGRQVAVYLNFSEGRFDLEIGAEVRSAIASLGEVVASALPAGEAATTTHFGPYSGLGQAHDAFRRWSASQNLALDGRCWEMYGHPLPEWNSDPSKIRTDVFYLLKR